MTSLKLEGFRHPLLADASLETRYPTQPSPDTVPSGLPVTTSKNSIMLIVIAGDKGLCGSYNTNLIRTALRFITASDKSGLSTMGQAGGPATKIITLGRKTAEYFKKHPLTNMELVATHSRLPVDLGIQQIKEIMKPFVQAYTGQTVSEVWLAYTEFVNAMIHKPRITRLLPISAADPSFVERKALSVERPRSTLPYGYLFEPKSEVILERLLPQYLELVFYRLILESLASEQSARMMAMRNATDNAEEVVAQLELTFNKARQSSITKELLDIIGGVEAMRG